MNIFLDEIIPNSLTDNFNAQRKYSNIVHLESDKCINLLLTYHHNKH